MAAFLRQPLRFAGAESKSGGSAHLTLTDLYLILIATLTNLLLVLTLTQTNLLPMLTSTPTHLLLMLTLTN